MPRRTLNLGILAHVDAGKTSLTERLLYAAGVIDEIGSVDAGTTRTDSLELERRRGITIRSAVASLQIDDVLINIIDTPGHPDFIAEVERVLSVLDGAILVVSAVEGVQPQTRILMRALQRLQVPTLLFVNKIDRRGADRDRVIGAIARRLSPNIIAMERTGFAARLHEALAEHDDVLLKSYVEGERIGETRLRTELAAQTRRGQLHPVYFGSARTGAGVPELMRGLVELLPTAPADADGPLSGRVFKIERTPSGEKVAYVRVFSGTVHIRDRIGKDRVTGIESHHSREHVGAGEIGKLRGLGRIRVGDPIGLPRIGTEHHFAAPTLETVVTAKDRLALKAALTQLAEQDPLIDVRQDERYQEISVSLYGEVQKEVIQATLANDYGIDVAFQKTTTIHVERPAGAGEAVELLNTDSNPFMATIGLRIEPAPPESGVTFRLRVEARTVPQYAYRNVAIFTAEMEHYVRDSLREGPLGWRVTDCVVTMFQCGYSSADGPPSTRGPLSTPNDFRQLTPLVLGQALRNAGTVLCEPMLRARLEIPAPSIGALLTALARLGAAVRAPVAQGELATIEAVLPAARMQELERRLPGLTGGEGVVETTFAGYQPARTPIG